jgi:hypothetical protein
MANDRVKEILNQYKQFSAVPTEGAQASDKRSQLLNKAFSKALGKDYGAPKDPEISPVQAADPALGNVSKDIHDLIVEKSEAYNVPQELIYAIIEQESGFRPDVTGPPIPGRDPDDRAMGLMQLMPEMQQSLGVEDPFDPEQNMDGGVRLLRELMDNFNDDPRLTIMSYHQGAPATRRTGGKSGGPHNRQYVKEVTEKFKKYMGQKRLPKIPHPKTFDGGDALAATQIEDATETAKRSKAQPQPGMEVNALTALPVGIAHGSLSSMESVGWMLDYMAAKMVEIPSDIRLTDYPPSVMMQIMDDAQKMSSDTGIPVDRTKTYFMIKKAREIAATREGAAEFLHNQADIITSFWGEQAEQFRATNWDGDSVWDNPEMMKSPTWWLYNIGEQGVSVGLTVGGGGAGALGGRMLAAMTRMGPKGIAKMARLGAAVTGGSVGGALEGTATYKSVLQNGGELDEAKRAAELMFFASAGLNAISVDAIMKPVGKKFLQKAGKRLAAGSWEATTEWAEGPAEVGSILAAKYMTGADMPEDVTDLFVESFKESVDVLGPSFVMGLMFAGGNHRSGAMSNYQRIRDQIGKDLRKKEAEQRETVEKEEEKKDVLDEKAVAKSIARKKKKQAKAKKPVEKAVEPEPETPAEPAEPESEFQKLAEKERPHPRAKDKEPKGVSDILRPKEKAEKKPAKKAKKPAKKLEDLTKEEIDKMSDKERARAVLGEEASEKDVEKAAKQAKTARDKLEAKAKETKEKKEKKKDLVDKLKEAGVTRVTGKAPKGRGKAKGEKKETATEKKKRESAAKAEEKRKAREDKIREEASNMSDEEAIDTFKMAQGIAKKYKNEDIVGEVSEGIIAARTTDKYKSLKTEKAKSNYLRKAGDTTAINAIKTEARKGVGSREVKPIVTGTIDTTTGETLSKQDEVQLGDSAQDKVDKLFSQIEANRAKMAETKDAKEKKKLQAENKELQAEMSKLMEQSFAEEKASKVKRNKEAILKRRAAEMKAEAERKKAEEEAALEEMRAKRKEKPKEISEHKQRILERAAAETRAVKEREDASARARARRQRGLMNVSDVGGREERARKVVGGKGRPRGKKVKDKKGKEKIIGYASKKTAIAAGRRLGDIADNITAVKEADGWYWVESPQVADVTGKVRKRKPTEKKPQRRVKPDDAVSTFGKPGKVVTAEELDRLADKAIDRMARDEQISETKRQERKEELLQSAAEKVAAVANRGKRKKKKDRTQAERRAIAQQKEINEAQTKTKLKKPIKQSKVDKAPAPKEVEVKPTPKKKIEKKAEETIKKPEKEYPGTKHFTLVKTKVGWVVMRKGKENFAGSKGDFFAGPTNAKSGTGYAHPRHAQKRAEAMEGGIQRAPKGQTKAEKLAALGQTTDFTDKQIRAVVGPTGKQMVRKVVDHAGTSDAQGILNHYIKKYKLPNIKVAYRRIVKKNGERVLGRMSRKKGIHEIALDPAMKGHELEPGVLRHEIEHLKDLVTEDFIPFAPSGAGHHRHYIDFNKEYAKGYIATAKKVEKEKKTLSEAEKKLLAARKKARGGKTLAQVQGEIKEKVEKKHKLTATEAKDSSKKVSKDAVEDLTEYGVTNKGEGAIGIAGTVTTKPVTKAEQEELDATAKVVTTVSKNLEQREADKSDVYGSAPGMPFYDSSEAKKYIKKHNLKGYEVVPTFGPAIDIPTGKTVKTGKKKGQPETKHTAGFWVAKDGILMDLFDTHNDQKSVIADFFSMLKSKKGNKAITNKLNLLAEKPQKAKGGPLTPAFDAWTNFVIRKWDQISRPVKLRMLKSDNMTSLISTFVTDFGQDEAYKNLRSDMELAEHRWNVIAEDRAREIEAIDREFEDVKDLRISKARENTQKRIARRHGEAIAAMKKLTEKDTKKMSAEEKIKHQGKIVAAQTKADQILVEGKRLAQRERGDVHTVSKKTLESRMRQIASGSLTTFDDKFAKLQKTTARFDRLEKELRKRGLLNTHQFLEINRRQRAKLLHGVYKTKKDGTKYLDDSGSIRGYEREITEKTERLTAAEEANNGKLAKKLTGEINEAIKDRLELITRLQVHYKNSGRNYVRMIRDKKQRIKDDVDRFRKVKLSRQYALRRENWAIKLKNDGTVDVKHKSNLKGVPMKDLAYSVRKGINEEARDIFLFDLFSKIEKNKRWTLPEGATDTKGYERIDNNVERYGPLAGRQVAKPIANEINQYTRVYNGFQKAWMAGIRRWKAGKTVWNPATQVRNFVSNVVLADIIGGLSWYNPFDWKYYARGFQAIHAINRGDRVEGIAKEIKLDTRIQRGTFTKAEIEDANRWFSLDNIQTSSDVINGFLKASAKGMKQPGQLYSLVEEGMKAAIYMKHRDAGLTKRDAERIAHKSLFDYSKVPPAIRWARQGYSPFATFIYKATPALISETFKRPWKLATYYGLQYLANQLFQALGGMDEDELEREERFLPEYMRRDTLPGFESHIRLPWTDDIGTGKWLDISYMVPWGELTEGQGDTNMWLRALHPNNPVWNAYFDLKANENIFLERPLSMKHDDGGEIAMKFIRHTAEQMLPGFASPRKWSKIQAAFHGDIDWKGDEYSIGEAVADTLFGIKIRSQNWMRDSQFRDKEINNEIKDLRTDFNNKYKEIFWTKRDAWSQEKKAEEVEKLYRWFNDEWEDIADKQFFLMGVERDE